MFLIEYVKKYKVTYISVILTFIIGMILGIFVTFKIPEDDKVQIQHYVDETLQTVKGENVNRQYIFKERLFSNLKFLGVVWLLGCTVIASFTIYILMIYKGFTFGYIMTIVLWLFGAKQGLKFLFPTLIIKSVIFLPFIFLLATSGIRMYKGIIKREINIKRELIRHTIVMVICLGFAIIVSCIDAYFEEILLHFL